LKNGRVGSVRVLGDAEGGFAEPETRQSKEKGESFYLSPFG
jgi:hypothetical protein